MLINVKVTVMTVSPYISSDMEKPDRISGPKGKQNQDSACEVRQSGGKPL